MVKEGKNQKIIIKEKVSMQKIMINKMIMMKKLI